MTYGGYSDVYGFASLPFLLLLLVLFPAAFSFLSLLSDDRYQVNHSFPVMTSSPPDISTLSLSSQRLHETYDYEGNAAARQQYHFNTTQGLQQSPYNPISSLGQSPLKSKSAIRAGLPSVRPLP